MKIRLACGAVALVLPAVAGAQNDPACAGPDDVSIGFTQPNNVAISNDNATRWPRDATPRFAYGGNWCPDPAQIELTAIDSGEGIPAQIRMLSPAKLVPNSATPLTLVDVDPLPVLDEVTDYRLIVRPSNPALPLFEEYTLEFRTRPTTLPEPPDFEGIQAVEPIRDGNCLGLQIFDFADIDKPAPPPPCPKPRRMGVRLVYQPVDRPDFTYLLYRTRSVPLDEGGEEDPSAQGARPDAILVGAQPGARDIGNGLPPREFPLEIPHFPLPRRDCFAVRYFDEWGREQGDITAEACIDIPVLEPCEIQCPQGGGPPPCFQEFPEPNPFEDFEPEPGQVCEALCLNEGDCESHEPPPPGQTGDAGAGGAGGDGGVGDGSVGAGEGSGEEGGGGGGGCSAVPGTLRGAAPFAALFGLLGLPLAFRRRR